MKPILAGALACILALAGTVVLLGPPAARVEAPPEDFAEPAALREEDASFEEGLERPTWRPGYAWRVLFPESDFACTLVVASTGDEGGYAQASACDGAPYLAAEDAVFGYAFMGGFTRELAGTREDETVWFYSWPLVDGKRWRTTWYGLDLDVTAKYAPDVPGRDGPEPGFRILMESDGEPFAAYDYVPSLAWWSNLTFAGGFRMEVTSFETGWQGEAFESEASAILSFSGPTFVGAFGASEEHDMLMLVRQVDAPGLERFQITAPSGTMVYQHNRVPLGTAPGFDMSYLPFEEGGWRIEQIYVGTGQPYTWIYGISTRPVLV